ncbi:MAG: translation initiation factor [Candidatus Bathyarchaeota archaeon]|nr:MAG: translation initiation factor [Candidatus Bathyarchaeota archaeon]
MAEICPVCGLPKDICACGEISRQQQRITVRVETRKWGRPITIIEGVDRKSEDLSRLAQKLKSLCACGGTAKKGQILLQGDQRERAKDSLIEIGFPVDNITVQ